MAVLIAAGVLVVLVTLVHRTFGGAPATVARVVIRWCSRALAGAARQPDRSVSTTDGRLALLVTGGGVPDRVVLLDGRATVRRSVLTIRLGAPAAPPR